MTNLLRADLYVLVRSRALWIALAVSSAMAVAYFVSARLIANGTYDMSISGSVAGFSDAMALPLLGSLLIGVAAASDLENRTVHDRLLAAPRSVHVAVKTVMALDTARAIHRARERTRTYRSARSRLVTALLLRTGIGTAAAGGRRDVLGPLP